MTRLSVPCHESLKAWKLNNVGRRNVRVAGLRHSKLRKLTRRSKKIKMRTGRFEGYNTSDQNESGLKKRNATFDDVGSF